ncbi:MAG: PASTA domain-containing protein [Acidobacteriaceae bacterium]
MLRAFRFLFVLLMLAGLALLSAIITMHFAIHGAEVTVPSFKGLTVAQATSKAATLGLNLSVENRYYSVDTPAGHVAGQSPAPGTVVRRAWHVLLTESLGLQKVAVPNLIGLDQRAASIQIRLASLDIGATAQIPWAYAPEGAVIAQNPAPGAAGVARPYVNLLLAAPPVAVSPAFVMPDLVGQDFTSAALAITHAGLKLGPVKNAPLSIPVVASAGLTQPIQPVASIGSIVSQNPEPGTRVDASTLIQLTVAQ